MRLFALERTLSTVSACPFHGTYLGKTSVIVTDRCRFRIQLFVLSLVTQRTPITRFESQAIQILTFIPMSSCLVAPFTAPLAVLLRFYGPFYIETYFVFSLEGADPCSGRSHVCMDNCLPSCILVGCQRRCTVHGHQKHYCQFLGKSQNHQNKFPLLDFPKKFLKLPLGKLRHLPNRRLLGNLVRSFLLQIHLGRLLPLDRLHHLAPRFLLQIRLGRLPAFR